MRWSSYQEAVFDDVAHGIGHTVVQAVAGSGKTSTIIESLRHTPDGCSILILAYNYKIKEELRGRVKAMSGELKRAGKKVQVLTFHGYGLQTANIWLGRLEVDERRVERLCSKSKTMKDVGIVKSRLIEKAVGRAKGALAATYDEVDRVIDECDDLELQTFDDRGWLIHRVLETLSLCRKLDDRSLDYDDMVWLPVVSKLKPRKYDRVLVDETQDLNPAQIELSVRAVGRDGRILAVGDSRQAIYGFRGADRNAMRNVINRLDAKVLPLSVCYRCARAVVAEARQVVPEIEAAPGAEEGDVIWVDSLRMMLEASPGDFILSRLNAPLIKLCLSFLAEGRPANILGRDLGHSLESFVRRGRTQTVEDLRDRVEDWARVEVSRLASQGRDPQAVVDRRECLLTLSDGALEVDEVLERIADLFSNRQDEEMIILSTTHKAKGLERDRVWLLEGTYRWAPGIEEDNLYYVAVTRARRTLFLVDGFAKKKRHNYDDEERFMEVRGDD